MAAHRSIPVSLKGFSLVELLVSIGIIVLLAALLFPVSKKLLQASSTPKCISHQKAILSAIFSYAADNQNTLPEYGQMGGSADLAWWVQLSGYLGSSERDPKYPGINYMRCPALKDDTRFATYGVNYGYSTYAPFSFSGVPPDYNGSMKLSRVSGNTFLIGDNLDPQPNGGSAGIYSPLVEGGWMFTSDKDGDGKNDSNANVGGKFNHLDPRHNNSAICGFADGSVRPITTSQWADNDGEMWGKFNQ